MNSEIKNKVHDLRVDMLRMFYMSKTGHMAPAFSCIDIFAILYFEPIINWEKRFAKDRDRVILSKGHACATLYATLAHAGYFPREELLTYYQKNTRLCGHPHISLPGVETATGSLGHGICFGTGTAVAAKKDGLSFRTYVVIGDGEIQEGSVWEAAMFAANQKLGNLTVIMDHNRLQASSWVEEIASISPIKDKWEAFGWNVLSVDGHDYTELSSAFKNAKSCEDRPTIIIANTIKGKGISFCENNTDWHSRVPKGDEWDIVCREFGVTLEELKII